MPDPSHADRMAATRKASTTDAAFAAAFAFGGPAPYNPGPDAEQQQAPAAAAPLPSSEAMSAGASRVLRLAQSDPAALAAEVEGLAMQAHKAEMRAARAEEELAAMRSTPAAQLARFNRTGSL
jgi:hypothetical protein